MRDKHDKHDKHDVLITLLKVIEKSSVKIGKLFNARGFGVILVSILLIVNSGSLLVPKELSWLNNLFQHEVTQSAAPDGMRSI
jgi:hypothetical protein